MTPDCARDECALRWIAGRLGYRLAAEPASGKTAPCWRMVCDVPPKNLRAGFMSNTCRTFGIPCAICPFGVTLSFFSPAKLLDDILTDKTAFMNPGLPLPNPFFGMSREELELRMAAAGV